MMSTPLTNIPRISLHTKKVFKSEESDIEIHPGHGFAVYGIPGICILLFLCNLRESDSWDLHTCGRWVCARAAATKGNPWKSTELAPDSWDLRTFLFVQQQQALNVYGIKDSWDMHTFFLYNLIWNIRGTRGRGVLRLPLLTRRLWFIIS